MIFTPVTSCISTTNSFYTSQLSGSFL